MNASALATVALAAAIVSLAEGCAWVIVPEEGAASATGGPASASAGASGSGGSGPEVPPVCSPTPWARGFGATEREQHPLAVAVDDDCNVILAGMVRGPIDLGGGLDGSDELHLAVIKLDAAGAYRWSRHLPLGAYWSFGKALAVDGSGNVLVAGLLDGIADFGGGPVGVPYSGVSDDLFLLKLDPDGHHLWSKAFHGDAGGVPYKDRDARAVAATREGDIIVTGHYEGSIDFGDGALPPAWSSGDIFLARFDATGEILSSTAYGGQDIDAGWGVAAGADGSFVLLSRCGPNALLPGTQLGADEYGVCLSKLGSAGGPVWTRLFSGGGNVQLAGVALDAAGSILLGGFGDGPIDLGGGPLGWSGHLYGFAAKLDAAGSHVWSRGFDHASVLGLASSPEGEAALTGALFGSVDFGGLTLESAGQHDVFVARFDAAGQLLNGARFGDVASQYGFGVAIDKAGRVLVSGSFGGSIDLGPGVIQAAGSKQDAFAARLPP